MLIWFALLIPVGLALYLAWAHGRSVTRWELTGLLLVALATVAIAKVTTDKALTADTEYWGGWIAQATYDEAWNERVSCRHTRYRKETYTTTDSDGHSVTRTRSVPDGTMHAYDVDEHPARWEAQDSNGASLSVSREHFERLARQFDSRRFVDMNRRYHTRDGDRYVTEWQGNDAAFEPATTQHRYENRIQASTSLYKRKPVKPADKERFQLFDYPRIRDVYRLDALMGDGGPKAAAANARLNRANAKLGAKKQVRLWLLVFKNQPREAGLAQEDYWLGGNKNEFILTVGVDDQSRVLWAHPISWTKVEDLKIEARNVAQEQETFDPEALAVWLEREVEARFVRRSFSEFSYLTVEPPLPALGLSYLVVSLVSGGFALWAVKNRHRNDGEPKRAKELTSVVPERKRRPARSKPRR